MTVVSVVQQPPQHARWCPVWQTNCADCKDTEKCALQKDKAHILIAVVPATFPMPTSRWCNKWEMECTESACKDGCKMEKDENT